jgi:hypothetical protein
MGSQKQCFVIAPIGYPGSSTRKRSDQILKHIIKPAVKKCGYEAIRADDIAQTGMITKQILQRVAEDPLVIADLTGGNPNVFYELAIRHALQKPLVQIIEKGEKLPFDIADTRTIYFDLDDVKVAKTKIVECIKAIEKNPSRIETPTTSIIPQYFFGQQDNQPLIEQVMSLPERKFLTGNYVDWTRAAEKIEIITLSMSCILESYGDQELIEWINGGKTIKILVLNPNASVTKLRGREEGIDLKRKILLQVQRLEKLCKESKEFIENPKKSSNARDGFKGSLEVRIYDGIPYFGYFKADNIMVIGLYYSHLTGVEAEALRIQESETGIFKKMIDHFNSLWEGKSEESDIDERRICIISDTKVEIFEDVIKKFCDELYG